MPELKLHLEKGVNLIAADSNGKSDPYVIIKIEHGPHARSKIISKTLNPVWNEEFKFHLKTGDETIEFEVFDKDNFKKDDFLGKATLSLKDIPEGVTKKLELGLSEVDEDLFEGPNPGIIHVTVLIKEKTHSDFSVEASKIHMPHIKTDPQHCTDTNSHHPAPQKTPETPSQKHHETTPQKHPETTPQKPQDNSQVKKKEPDHVAPSINGPKKQPTVITQQTTQPQTPIPQNGVPQNVVPVNQTQIQPQNTVPQNVVPQNGVPVNQTQIQQNPVPQNTFPQNGVPVNQNQIQQNPIPQNTMPIPQNSIPVPQNSTQSPIPQSPVPQNLVYPNQQPQSFQSNYPNNQMGYQNQPPIQSNTPQMGIQNQQPMNPNYPNNQMGYQNQQPPSIQSNTPQMGYPNQQPPPIQSNYPQMGFQNQQPMMNPMSSPLPQGWEMKYDQNSKPYYVDHIHKTSTYTDPRTQPQLPQGIEAKLDPQGRTYYVDHIHKTSSYTPPYPTGY